MDNYGIAGIRNVALLSHSGAGKTTLAEAALYSAGAISRMGKVDDGTTASDFDPEGMKRKISISLSLLPFIWQKTKINLLDAPGYADFAGEAKAAVAVSESMIIAVAASSGVEVGTEAAWAYADEAKVARCFVVNKMDRENVNFDNVVSGIQAKFGHKCLPVNIPIGAFKDFKGVVNLINMKAYTGAHPAVEGAIPPATEKAAAEYRAKLVEAIAEQDDTLIEEFLNGQELTPEEVVTGLKKAIAAGEIVPILAASALTNTGIDQLLDFIVNFLPSPENREVASSRRRPPQGGGVRTAGGACFQNDRRSLRRQADLLPRLPRHAYKQYPCLECQPQGGRESWPVVCHARQNPGADDAAWGRRHGRSSQMRHHLHQRHHGRGGYAGGYRPDCFPHADLCRGGPSQVQG